MVYAGRGALAGWASTISERRLRELRELRELRGFHEYHNAPYRVMIHRAAEKWIWKPFTEMTGGTDDLPPSELLVAPERFAFQDIRARNQ
jgi:hypothetical protein